MWGRFRVATYHGAGREAALASVASGRSEILITSYSTLRCPPGPSLPGHLARGRAVRARVSPGRRTPAVLHRVMVGSQHRPAQSPQRAHALQPRLGDPGGCVPGRMRSPASAAPYFGEAAGRCGSGLLRLAPALLRQDERGGPEQGAVALRRYGRGAPPYPNLPFCKESKGLSAALADWTHALFAFGSGSWHAPHLVAH